MVYVATQNIPGYLPTDDEPPRFESAREAWEYLRAELERGELAWEPERADDPDGPQKATRTALAIDEMVAHDKPGTVYGPSALGDDASPHDLGLAYCVMWTPDDDGGDDGGDDGATTRTDARVTTRCRA